VTWFKPREGDNTVRIIPWHSADERFDELTKKWGTHWGIDIIFHQGVGSDKGSYLCLDKMKGEPCPICDVQREEDIESLKQKDRVLVWLIDRDDEKAGPKLWAMPLGNSRDISNASVVKGSGELLAVDDPFEGYDVMFTREGTKRNTRYKQFAVARNPSPLHHKGATMDKWLDYVTEVPLPDMLKFYDADYLDKVLQGQSASDDDDEGEERGGKGGRDRGEDRPARRGRDRDDDNSRDDRRRDRDEDDGGGRSSRRSRDDDNSDRDDDRGRDRDRDRDDDSGGRSERRRPSRDEDDAEGEFTREARRPPRDAEEDGERDRDDDRGGGGGRSSRRGSREPENEGDNGGGRSSRRSRDRDDDSGDSRDDSGGGKTERYRGRGSEDAGKDGDPDDDGGAGKRLREVGTRRSRK
jgi:hypothetical protein